MSSRLSDRDFLSVIINTATIAMDVLEVIIFCVAVFRIKDVPFAQSLTYTPFLLAMLAFAAVLTLLPVFHTFAMYNNHDISLDHLNFTCLNVAVCFIQSAYVLYSWFRSQTILKIKMSGKKYHFWFVPLVAIIEIAIVSQIGLLFMQYLFPNVNLSSSISMTVSTTVGATIVIFDLAMLLIFYQFLNDTKVEFQTYDDRLSCISKYGFICNFLSILALGVYVTRAVIGRTAYNANVLLSFVYVIFNLIFCALLKMKYDLLVLDAAASNANESTIKGVDKL